MPKIIPNLKENIMSVGRDILIQQGYSGFSVRDIADGCQIAMGTLYNYFSGKDDLITEIMEEDWAKILEQNREGFQADLPKINRAELLFRCIREYRALYGKIWNELLISGHVSKERAPGHNSQMKQASEFSHLSRFELEIILHFALTPEFSFDDIRNDMKKVLK